MQQFSVSSSSRTVQIGHATDAVDTRDAYTAAHLVFPAPHRNQDRSSRATSVWYALIADGADPKSHTASQLAVESMYQTLSDSRAASCTVPQRLETAFQHANRTIRAAAQENATLRGMATSLLAAAILPDRIYLAHAGSGYAYLVRNGVIHRLARNRIAIQPASGAAAGQPLAGNRLLGGADTVDVEHDLADGQHSPQRGDHVSVRPGDILVLCSRGLAAALSAETILATVTSAAPNAAAERLVTQARQGYAHAHHTAVVFKWNKRNTRHIYVPSLRPRALPVLAIALLLLVSGWIALTTSRHVQADRRQMSLLSSSTPEITALGSAEPARVPPVAARDVATPATRAAPSQPQSQSQPHPPADIQPTRVQPTGVQSVTVQAGAAVTPAHSVTLSIPLTVSAESPALSDALQQHWSSFRQGAATGGAGEEAQSIRRTPTSAVAPAEPTAQDGPTAPITNPIQALPSLSTPALPISPTPRTHIIQPNDTLWDLARQHGLTVDALLAANPQLRTPDQILTLGMQITIPAP